MISLRIDGRLIKAEEGERVLQIAIREGIDIPHLCYHEAFEEPYGSCRLCIVELKEGGSSRITTSCTLMAREGMEIKTDTPEVIKHRKLLLELYLAQAPLSNNIKKLAERYGIKGTRFHKTLNLEDPLGGKCILCGLCIRACREIIKASAIGYIGRGEATRINTPFLEENPDCIGCGSCANICPTEAISFEDRDKRRIMRSWSNTQVNLKICKLCGHPFTPEPLWLKVKEKSTYTPSEEIEEVCSNCRIKIVSKRLVKPYSL